MECRIVSLRFTIIYDKMVGSLFVIKRYPLKRQMQQQIKLQNHDLPTKFHTLYNFAIICSLQLMQFYFHFLTSSITILLLLCMYTYISY